MTPEQRSIVTAVIKYVYVHLHVQPAILLSGSRTEIVVQARALAAVLMRGCGMSYGQIAQALHLYSRSSVCELIQTYRDRQWLREDAERFEHIESRFNGDEVFGNRAENATALNEGVER